MYACMDDRLVISSTGSISQVFTKLLTLNSKHSFDLALILDSSNDPKQLHELLGNKLDIPIPTFISSHNLASSTQAQLSPNLFLLGEFVPHSIAGVMYGGD